MLNDAYQNYSDICLVVGPENHKIYAHKLVLFKQSPYFAHSLLGPNRGKDYIYFKHYKVSGENLAASATITFLVSIKYEAHPKALIRLVPVHLKKF